MPDPPPPADPDPRMKGFRTRKTVEQALSLIDGRVGRLGSETVPLRQAAGRVLAAPIVATVSVPAFHRAAMDGYALLGEETFGSDFYNPAEFRVIGESLPGRPFAGAVSPGQAVRIATGAPLPEGADAVVPAESTSANGPTVRVIEPTPPGRHVGRIGEDVTSGARVFEVGRGLRPQDVGLLSALGLRSVEVVRRPRVAVIVTGDELLPPGSPPRGCLLADMNSVMLEALIARDGGLTRVFGPLPDDRDDLRQLLSGCAREFDVLLVSGGSSTGPEDHAPGLVRELGELPAHGIALRPASPTGIGFLGAVPVVLLPGNPVSCLCAYDLFGGRIVRILGGRSPDWPYRPVSLPLGEKLISCLGRVDYARVRIELGSVFPISTSGASILSSTSRADGVVLVPAEREGYPPGEIVTVWLYEPGA